MTHHRSTARYALGVALLVTAFAGFGCATSPVDLQDDIEVDLDLFTPPHDHLHQPYVLGTSVTIRAVVHDHGIDTSRLRFESGDPSVLRVDGVHNGSAGCTALGAGQTTLTVLDGSGHPLHTATIDVRAPTRAVLVSNGALRAGESEAAATVATPHIVVGGTAAYIVHYFDGDTRLFGNGVLAATPTSDMDATPMTTFLLESREWLVLVPNVVGDHAVQLRAAGTDLGTVPVVAVSRDAIDHLTLSTPNEGSARESDALSVHAQAVAADGTPIDGAAPTWQLDGATATGMGDLFTYNFAAGHTRQLEAHVGDTSATATIHGTDGSVSSSASVGCSAVPGAASGALPFGLGLVGLALVVRRRRRARRTIV